MLAPLVFGWRLISPIVASNVLPGALIALGAGYCGISLLPYGSDETRARLTISLTSSTLILGVWLLISPFVLGIALFSATYYAQVLPGIATVGLSLANGYLGWRDPE